MTLYASKYDIYDNSERKMPHPLTSDMHGFLCNAPMDDLETLLMGYRFGIFPWDNVAEIGVFFYPKSRYVIEPANIRIPKSMRPYFSQPRFTATIDKDFARVIRSCRTIRRKGQHSTWISDQFEKMYNELHEAGFAHSVEVWHGDRLVGGLYGIAIGKVFTGESMFSQESNAARYAMIFLAQKLAAMHFEYIDCQVYNPYLESFGGSEISGKDFFDIMHMNLFNEDCPKKWAT
ncbi:MAG: leucyl/phenylalanyl-tRNA--protein transferase [Saprospiraceae bacterium]|nr:leucyl/phenylalanyl-tRNA--protein transferase [Saprospiraceae bacterium]